ncbi:hypothetical protein [Kordiimonas sp.]|uniref:hypothetical protein n=1 Tax=Kordiimonas sp. TaxID=1970157 RepID=UPI003B52851E
MPIPLLFWGAVALGTALGIGGTVATTDAADEIGDAVSQGANSITKLTKVALLAGTAYVAYKHRGTIGKMFK